MIAMEGNDAMIQGSTGYSEDINIELRVRGAVCRGCRSSKRRLGEGVT